MLGHRVALQLVDLTHTCAGLKSLASLQSTRQLDERTAASLALTWQPGLGAGLQLQTNRQLTERVQGLRLLMVCVISFGR